jgi:DNA-directed RNA polymerase subunit M/transcription elongation factor TFIIS
MTTPERDRIAAVYGGMTDEELKRIAQSGDELTEVAQEALNAEAARRSLSIVVNPLLASEVLEPDPTLVVDSSTEYDDVELNRTVTLQRFRDLPQALLAKGSLESAGLQAYVIDDNMVRMDWFISNSLGGIKLQVHPEDVEAATAILNQPIPESLEVEGVGDYEQPRCPKCHSLDVSYRERLRSLLSGRDTVAWTCATCGNEWEGPDDASPGV